MEPAPSRSLERSSAGGIQESPLFHPDREPDAQMTTPSFSCIPFSNDGGPPSIIIERQATSFDGCSLSFTQRQRSSSGGNQQSFELIAAPGLTDVHQNQSQSSINYDERKGPGLSVVHKNQAESSNDDDDDDDDDDIGISLVGSRFKVVYPIKYFVLKAEEADEEVDGSSAINDLVSSKLELVDDESTNSPNHPMIEPLFTMKEFKRYVHAPNENLLVQFVKSQHTNENLYDIIHPAQKLDPESFKILSETAFKCVKDQRSQRPNIDQILRNLKQALEIQKKLDNSPPPLSANENELGTSSNCLKAVEHLKIPLTDIIAATNNFTKRYLGSGAYGKVYAAELDLPIQAKNNGAFSKKKRTVAIKCIKKDANGKEGFVAGIELLARCKHENIASLIGFSDEGDELILVYKYVSNGSLDDYLGVNHRLTNLSRLTCIYRLTKKSKENKGNLQMSFKEIQSATQNFASENIIGGGGYGKVYKGEATRGNERRTIVAKRIDKKGGEGEIHFLTELEVLFEYKHDNIIGLEGFCNEKDEKIIVYEHAPKLSLEKHLKDESLTWTTRLKICIDVAIGLAFLHGGAPTNEIVIHRDIKCAKIVLSDDWKAKISDFGLSAITTANQEVISNLVCTDAYVDPLCEVTGHFTEKSDIYSLGVVLFEILYGKLLVPNIKNYDKEQAPMILKQIHDEEKLDSIVFKAMKNDIAPKSLSTFRMIVSQCLQLDRKKRPTASEVLQHLNKALELQEDYEIWKPKLPQEYEEIIKKSKSSSFIKRKTNLYNMFTKGIHLQDNKVWFSLGSNGKRNAIISSRKFSYRNRSPHKWQSISESRFQKVAEMLDISNLMIKIKTTTKYLSPAVGYGVYVVFKFCNLKELSSKPMYVNLKYTKGSERSHAYFATWRDKEWMMIELDRFINQTELVVFKFLLESFSPYYYADDAIYIEGIEFRTINIVEEHKEMEKSKEAQQVLNSNLKNEDQVQEFPSKSEEIFKKSNDGEKLLPPSEMNGKKHLMLSARTTLYNISDLKRYKSTPSAESRFQEVVELLPQQVFRINCTIKAQILSPDTIYVCYLVFKLSEECQGFHFPVEVRDLLHRGNKEAEIVYFKTPSPWNLYDVTQVPNQREDGWMEVKVWRSNSDHTLKNDLLVSFDRCKNVII